jgi:hypothetical protein
MDTSTTIMGLAILLIFLIPVFLIARSGKKKGSRFERDFFSECSRRELNITEKDILGEIGIGLDQVNKTLLYMNWGGHEKSVTSFSLKEVKSFETMPPSSAIKKPNFDYKKVERLGFRFNFINTSSQELTIIFYTAGFGKLSSAELNMFKKWNEIIRKNMSTDSLNNLKNSA